MSMWNWVSSSVRLPRRLAEQRGELVVGHAQAGAVVEIALVQPEAAVVVEVDELVQDQRRVFGLAIGREPHHLVLAGIHLEARCSR